MTGFILKTVALLTMVLDHIKYAIPITNGFITQYFGRISFPLFAFFITEGYIHTSNRKKYIKRLFIFALISQIPFMLFRTLIIQKLMLNILFTFLFAILGIQILEYLNKNEKINKFFTYIISVVSFFTIAILGEFLHVDYGWFGILAVWIFYIFKNKKFITLLVYSALVFIYYCSLCFPTMNNINLISLFFTILPGIIILFYNGKEGKKVKYVFYAFYPIHMLILYGISFIL